MEIRPIEESDFEQLKKLYLNAYVLKPEQVDRWFTDDTDFSRTRALFIGGRMKAITQIIPFEIWLSGIKMPMGGIGGVATLPESRRRGHVAKLMEYAITDMRKRRFPLSCLWPFSYAFYRRFGWEHACDVKLYSFSPRDLAQTPAPRNEMVPFGEKELPLIRRVYERFSTTKNCSLVRNQKDWTGILTQTPTRHSYLWKDPRGKTQGYIIYDVEPRGPAPAHERKMKVRELVALNHEARCAIFSFLRNHDSQVGKVEFRAPSDDFSNMYFSEYGLESKSRSGFMARVVDVTAALETRRYPPALKSRAIFKIADRQAPWNNGTFLLSISGGAGRVKKTRSRADFACDIQTFSQIYCGHLDLLRAAEIGKIETSAPRKLPRINGYFATATPYMNDSF